MSTTRTSMFCTEADNKFPLGEVILPEIPPEFEDESDDEGFLCLGDYITRCLGRHQRGEWGLGVPDADLAIANAYALEHGGRLISRFYCNGLDSDSFIEIVTEADRSVTRIILPKDLSWGK